MGVSLVELNGMVGRTQDYSSIKQNEDNRPYIEQSNLHVRQEKKEDTNANTVHHADDTEGKKMQSDAREKGNGTYAGDGGRNRKKQCMADGKVIKKGQSHFDMSV